MESWTYRNRSKNPKTPRNPRRRGTRQVKTERNKLKLLWRCSEDRAAAAELGAVLEIHAPSALWPERFTAFLFRGLILLGCHQFGAALADLWEAAQLRSTPQLEVIMRFATGSGLEDVCAGFAQPTFR